MLPITIKPKPEREKPESDPVRIVTVDSDDVIYGDEWWRKATGTERHRSVLVGV